MENSNLKPATFSLKISEEELSQIRERVRRREIELRKTLLSLFTRTIADFKDRIEPFLTEPEMEIDWRRLFQEKEWNHDEVLALQWLRSLWDEKMYVRTREYGGLFPENWELRQAVFLALAEAHHLSHMIDDYFRKKSASSIDLSA